MSDSNNSNFYSVMLPCGHDDFREFISGLLGKPQEIERMLRGEFELKKEDINNIFHLVDQRISQQNEASLTQFTVKVLYNDDSSIFLNSLEDFMNYNEIRPLISESIYLTWVYLIKFRDKATPEKQTITLRIFTQPAERYHDVLEDEIVFRKSAHDFMNSRFVINIENTARSWGVDIESLLVGHIRTLIKKHDKTLKYLNKNSSKAGIFMSFAFIVLCVYGIYSYWNSYIDLLKSNFIKISENVKIVDFNIINSKVNFISNMLTSQIINGVGTFISISFIVSIIISIIIGIITSELCTYKYKSYLLLTSETIQYAETEKKKSKFRLIKVIFFVLGTLLLGVMSNYIYAIIKPLVLL